MSRVAISIGTDGSVRFIDARGALVVGPGRSSKRRVSRVEPAHVALRLAFLAIRALTREDARVAAWTRRWPCSWRARIYGGPTKAGFASREDAIAWEIAWVQQRGL